MRIKTMTAPPRYRELEDEIELREEKEPRSRRRSSRRPRTCATRSASSREEAQLEEKWRSSEQVEQPEIGEEEIADIVSMWTGIPVFKLTEAESQKLIRMEDGYTTRDRPARGDHRRLRSRSAARGRSRTEAPDRLVHLPRSLGRREDQFARTSPEFLFGDEDAMIRWTCRSTWRSTQCPGSSARRPATSATEEAASSPRPCAASPYSVVLLDEIEKAHPDVFNILLQILEDGKLTDALARKVDFRNTIVIMTSNIGMTTISKNQSLGSLSATTPVSPTRR